MVDADAINYTIYRYAFNSCFHSFRYANYYYVNATQKRDLIKATGIRFIIKVNGEAGKFSVVPLLLNLGSGLGLLAIVSSLDLLFGISGKD